MNEEVIKKLFVFVSLILIIAPVVSAGVGISWNKETSYVPEHTKTCLTYKVYNPWPKDSYVKIKLSEDLMKLAKSSSSDTVFIPKETPSSKAIPVKFCFKTPRVYQRSCLLFNKLICKQTCTEPIKTYSGEVDVMEVSSSKLASGGAGGSATAMSVSAPLRIRVKCIKHSRNYTIIYLLIALIAGALLAADIFKKKKKLKDKKKTKGLKKKKRKPAVKKKVVKKKVVKRKPAVKKKVVKKKVVKRKPAVKKKVVKKKVVKRKPAVKKKVVKKKVVKRKPAVKKKVGKKK